MEEQNSLYPGEYSHMGDGGREEMAHNKKQIQTTVQQLKLLEKNVDLEYVYYVLSKTAKQFCSLYLLIHEKLLNG